MSKQGIAGPEIERLIQLLAKLPGLGPRSARRAALHLIKKKDQLLVPLADAMGVAVGKETSRMEGGLTTLAIIGSSAPFIGLFGTVWGIMNSFRSIAAARETNLAVVAPGIAEALFATGLGLLAAIPATIFYNKFSSDIGKFGEHMDSFSEEFSVRLSRRLAERLDD